MALSNASRFLDPLNLKMIEYLAQILLHFETSETRSNQTNEYCH